MLDNNFCESCNKAEVCKNKDILYKFDESAKKNLGIDLTMDSCDNFVDAAKDAIKTDS